MSIKTKFDSELLNEMHKNPNNWRGIFYYNHQDTRLVVPKRYPSLGWTFNFANPLSYILLIGLIAAMITISYVF